MPDAVLPEEVIPRMPTAAVRGAGLGKAWEKETATMSFLWSAMNWSSDSWAARLSINLAGYLSVILPGYLFLLYIRRTGYLERTASVSCWARIVRACIVGSPPHSLPSTTEDGGVRRGGSGRSPNPSERFPQGLNPTFLRRALELMFCAVGLLVSYLVWGLLQERVMAYEYAYEYGGADRKTLGRPAKGRGERFGNSQFVVFTNRILALVVAGVIIMTRSPRRSTVAPSHSSVEQGGITVLHLPPVQQSSPPLYKYAYSSLSNILSSWCQYEALKYVSFPVQVLAKASKVIPVMLMGRIVSRKSYSWSEYLTASAISAGLFLFLISSDIDGGGGAKASKVTTISGVVILASYLAFDSFTSNWQGELFKTYHMSSIDMMFGVNLFSVLLTSVSLLQQGAFIEAVQFTVRHPTFGLHILVLSLTSAVGQLFIYRTIERFGAVTFTIVMTIRQAVAVLLSAVVYGHQIDALGALGIAIVFLAVFLRAGEGRGRRRPSAGKGGGAGGGHSVGGEGGDSSTGQGRGEVVLMVRKV